MNPTHPAEHESANAGLPPAPGVSTTPPDPDFKRAVRRFFRDESGQSMVEFIVVIPMLLFLVMGIVQFSLNTIASYFANLGNFYALRSAAVIYEDAVVGNRRNGHVFPDDCLSTARYFMAPAWFVKGDMRASGMAFASITVNQVADTVAATRRAVHNTTGGGNRPLQPQVMQMRLTFDYPMMMPVARNVIAAAQAVATNPLVELTDPMSNPLEPLRTFDDLEQANWLTQDITRIGERIQQWINYQTGFIRIILLFGFFSDEALDPNDGFNTTGLIPLRITTRDETSTRTGAQRFHHRAVLHYRR